MRKILFTFLFLILACSIHAQQKYILSGATGNGDWTFPNGISISNTNGKTFTTGLIETVKYSVGVQYTINIPEGMEVKRVIITGYSNSTTDNAYLSELGGTSYSSDEYVFPLKDSTPTTTTYSFDLSTPATGTLTFTGNGAQSCWIITLCNYVDYEFSQNANEGGWNFAYGASISNTAGKEYEASKGQNGTIKYSKNVQYTIHIPEGASISRAVISGYCNSSSGDAYLKELNGTTYGSTEYVFPMKDGTSNVNKEYTIEFDSPVTNTLTFTADGQQVAWIIKLYSYTVIPGVSYQTPSSQMEALGRGLVVLPSSTGSGQFISWRLLGTEDYNTTTFDVLRDGVTIASKLSDATSFTDAKGTTSNTYQVVTYHGTTKVSTTEGVKSWSEEYLPISLQQPSSGYTPNDMSVGDIDGDGEYELFLKWDPSNSKDNSQSGITGNVYIDCYRMDGTFLWRIDLGKNIRAGAHYTQFLVYDFDGDGRAELICKTGPGSLDSQGNYVSSVADDTTISSTDNSADYRNSSGYIPDGPEFLTVFNGATGKAIHTIWYNPNRGMTFNKTASHTSSWGDSYTNRSDRHLACVAYLDGQYSTPSAVMCRGYYTQAFVWAVKFDGSKLNHKWLHASTSKTKVEHYDANWTKTEKTYSSNTSGDGNSYTLYGNGNHNLSVADVDGDGADEIVWGSGAVDNDGQLLYSVGFGHGDAIHLADLDPDRPGLELFDVHEDERPYSWDLHDAATGEVIFQGGNSGVDNGRGIAAQLSSTDRGYYFSSSDDRQQRSAVTGEVASTNSTTVNFRIYWDGDLQDELLDGHYNSSIGYGDNVYIDKWTGTESSRIKSLARSLCNTTKLTPNLQADILGDWREELILWDYNDPTKIYIYSSNLPTEYRVPTLMHDHVYRMGIAWQNVAYNQPPHLGYYLPDYVKYLKESFELSEPNIEIVDMAQALTKDVFGEDAYPSANGTNHYYLPIVDATTDTPSSFMPEIKGKFTDLEGNETIIAEEQGTEIFAKDYESDSDASSWTTKYATLNFLTGDATYGNYVQIVQGGGSGPRSAYTKFYNSGTFYNEDQYCVEMDVAFQCANNSSENQIILFGEGASMPASNSLFNDTNYLFKLSGGANNSTSYLVEGGEPITFSNDTWHHLKIVVDKSTSQVKYTISKEDGNYKVGVIPLESGASGNIQGIFIGLGRANSYAKIDNIVISNVPTPIFPYTFSQLGTLEVTTSVAGYDDASATFESPRLYVIDPDSSTPASLDDYLPVDIYDEMSKNAIEEKDLGNAHLWRSGLKDNAGWATMVMPYSMDATQISQTFGTNAVVANLITSAGDAHSLYFETESNAIQANVPFLIKGVTTAPPYLIREVSASPVLSPMESTTYYQFIGNYEYSGEQTFSTSDYFFTSEGLRTAKYDNIKMTLPGYRAYFHAIGNSNGVAPQIIFDDGTGINDMAVERQEPLNVYTLSGQLIRANAKTLKGLPQGIYLVNGKKVTIK